MTRKETYPLAAGPEAKVNPDPELDLNIIPYSACTEPSPSAGWRAVYGCMGVRV